MNYRVIRKNELRHHGIEGQRWGIKNGPPYPLDHTRSSIKKTFGAHVRFKDSPELPREELYRARELARRNPEVDMPIGVTKSELISDMNTNLPDEQRSWGYINYPYGNYTFDVANFGFNDYHIFGWEPTEPTFGIVDEVLYEMFGPEWRKYLDE